MHIKGSFDSHFHNDINYYRGRCGMCQNYDLKSTNHRGCRCQIHTRKNLAFDDSCSYQRDDRSRSIKDIKKAFESIRGYDPAMYYIATVVKNTLKNEKALFYYELVQEFWLNILPNSNIYNEFLTFYDILGKLLAIEIERDENREKICTNILENYFVPFGAYVEMHDYDKALAIYLDMVNNLRTLYNEAYLKYQSKNLEDYQLTRIKRF